MCTFCNNLRLLHDCIIIRILTYLASMCTYTDLSDVNRRLSACDVVYSPKNEKELDVTWMSNLPVVGLKQMLIMQKIICLVWDM